MEWSDFCASVVLNEPWQACIVEEATILSTSEEPSRVTSGSVVTTSLIQYGVTMDRGCIVSNSLLMEHSHVDNHGKVRMRVRGLVHLFYSFLFLGQQLLVFQLSSQEFLPAATFLH